MVSSHPRESNIIYKDFLHFAAGATSLKFTVCWYVVEDVALHSFVSGLWRSLASLQRPFALRLPPFIFHIGLLPLELLLGRHRGHMCLDNTCWLWATKNFIWCWISWAPTYTLETDILPLQADDYSNFPTKKQHFKNICTRKELSK